MMYSRTNALKKALEQLLLLLFPSFVEATASSP